MGGALAGGGSGGSVHLMGGTVTVGASLVTALGGGSGFGSGGAGRICLGYTTISGSTNPVSYTYQYTSPPPPPICVNTANWTSIVKAANKVAMGNAVAVISFTAVAAGTITTAHWRRFRIDETGGQPIEKLSVSVYEESGNDGFFDAGDRFIASGTFNSARTCILNMNRWPIGTTAKTYYIVEKVALDGSGGATIRLNIDTDNYFDFEEGNEFGVQP